MWKLHGNRQRLYARCLSTSYSMAFSWSWTVQATWRRAFSFSRMMLPMSSPRVWNQLNDIWFSHYWTIKENIHGPVFMSQDSMHEDLVQWLRQQPKELFADGICQFVHHCYSCLITVVIFSVANFHLWGFSCTYHTQKHEKTGMNLEISLHSKVLRHLFWKIKLL